MNIDHNDFLAERKMSQETNARREPAMIADFGSHPLRQFRRDTRDAARSLD